MNFDRAVDMFGAWVLCRSWSCSSHLLCMASVGSVRTRNVLTQIAVCGVMMKNAQRCYICSMYVDEVAPQVLGKEETTRECRDWQQFSRFGTNEVVRKSTQIMTSALSLSVCLSLFSPPPPPSSLATYLENTYFVQTQINIVSIDFRI